MEAATVTRSLYNSWRPCWNLLRIVRAKLLLHEVGFDFVGVIERNLTRWLIHMTHLSAREFNQDVSAAKRAAESEPVIVTDRGRPAYVLLNIEEYRRLTSRDHEDFLSALSTDDDDIEFERMDFVPREPEL